MKFIFSIIILLSCSFCLGQVVPNVSVDSLVQRLFPIYTDAVKKGIYDLPRDTAWKNLSSYNYDALSIQIPANWLNLGGVGDIVEGSFDGSGLYFPERFNGKPVLVGAFLLKQPGSSLDEAKEFALKSYRSNPDRIFENNYKDSVYNYDLQNGAKAYILHTRFLRNSTQLNQSRYDLILFSEKQKKAYSVMLSIQYYDRSFNFESANSLNVLAARLFSHVVVK